MKVAYSDVYVWQELQVDFFPKDSHQAPISCAMQTEASAKQRQGMDRATHK